MYFCNTFFLTSRLRHRIPEFKRLEGVRVKVSGHGK